MKIITIGAMEKHLENAQPVAEIILDESMDIVFVDLNFAETHLYVLTCAFPNETEFEYALSVYALESVAFDRNSNELQVANPTSLLISNEVE